MVDDKLGRGGILCVDLPPSKGPATEATPNTAPLKPIYKGLFSSGTVCIIKITDPAVIPAEPIPAIARPNMKAVELGAAPQTAEPTSKRKIADKKTSLGE